MNSNFTSILSTAIVESVDLIEKDVLSFTLSTGKCELLIRDLIATKLDQLDSHAHTCFAAREWRKHDLTVFHEDALVAIIEGKAWIHADILNESKLIKGKNSVLQAAKNDIHKIIETKNEFPHTKGYLTTLLVTCDSRQRFFTSNNPITYDAKHRRAISQYNDVENLVRNANLRYLNFISESFPSSKIQHIRYFQSTYREMYLSADIFVQELD